MMKRKKTGSNAAAEAEEKARLEASTSGERREGRGIGSFVPLALVPHLPSIVEKLLPQTTTPRPDSEILSQNT